MHRPQNPVIKDSISIGRALRYWWSLVTRSSVKSHISSDGGILPLLESDFQARDISMRSGDQIIVL